MKRYLTALLLGLVLWPVSASAQNDSRVIYQRGAWMVRVVTFDDASLSCVAQVDKPGSSFAIWANGRTPFRLQFYSSAWQLGSKKADIVVRIDRRAPWNLYNATLNINSVLFDLPNDNDGYRFLREVMRGGVIYLSNNRGVQVDQWTLSGSSASIQSLTDCIEMIRLRNPASPVNPFN